MMQFEKVFYSGPSLRKALPVFTGAAQRFPSHSLRRSSRFPWTYEPWLLK